MISKLSTKTNAQPIKTKLTTLTAETAITQALTPITAIVSQCTAILHTPILISITITASNKYKGRLKLGFWMFHSYYSFGSVEKYTSE
jgi:hypothetical protein